MFALREDNKALCIEDYKSIKKGAIVPKVNELWAEVMEWLDSNNGVWLDTPLPVGEIKEAKNREIEQERDAALTNPTAKVTTDDGTAWQVDPKSLHELNKATALFTAAGGTLPGYEWRDANNINHPADLALLVAIGVKRAEQENAIWRHSWALKEQLRDVIADNSLSDAEKITAIESIKWSI